MSLKNYTVGFIGAGNMAEALIKGIIESGICESSNIWASDISVERGNSLTNRYNINFLKDNRELVAKADYVVYAVKPFLIEQILAEVSPVVKEGQVHISIAAGVSIEQIEEKLPENTPVIRVMPNTPCLIGTGASAYALGKTVNPQQEQALKKILESTGVSVKVSEQLLNAVTGLSGSGPAYAFLIIEALADAGVKNGLPRDTALLLAAQTVMGSARMVLETGEHPAKLKDMVTTPGGTTIAGVHVLENGRLRGVLIDAVTAAADRAGELGSNKK